MPNRKLSMRKTKEILRLKWACGLSERKISLTLSIAHSTVADHLRRATLAGLSWPLPSDMDDEQLDKLLFPPPPPGNTQRPLLDFVDIHQELKLKGVTLQLLWEEYKENHPDGYQYSQFCELYRQWAGKLDLSMRQIHKAGEKMFDLPPFSRTLF